MIELHNYITLVSAAVWFLTPLRQYKGRYFFFFLVLALADPFYRISQYFYKFDSNSILLVVSVMMLLSLALNLRKLISWFVVLPIFLFSLFADKVLTGNQIFLIIALIQVIILFIFLKDTIINIQETSEINLFFWMLVFYEITIVAKFIPMITDVTAGVNYFISMNAVQVLIGVFFWVFTETSKSIRFGFKTQPGNNTRSL